MTSLLLGSAEKAVSYSMVVVVAAQPHPTPSEEEEESGLVRATTVSGFSMYVLMQGKMFFRFHERSKIFGLRENKFLLAGNRQIFAAAGNGAKKMLGFC